MDTLTIGQVAERTGFTPAALRYYDEMGLVTPTSRTDAGYRLYDHDALDRLAFIARAKQLGCSLDDVADLLVIWDGDRCAAVQTRFHELVADKIRATQAQIDELIVFASQLHTAARRLAEPASDDPCGEGCACLSSDDGAVVMPIALRVSPTSEVPVACTLQPGAMPERVAEWQRVLASVTTRTRTVDDRLRIEFTPDVDVAELARLVEAEQHCCAFFAFALTIDGRGTALEVAAPDDARDIVDVLFGTAS